MHGLHAVRALLERAPAGVARLHHLRGRDDARIAGILHLAREAGIALRAAERAELGRLAGSGAHQGVVAELRADARGPASPAGGASRPDAPSPDDPPRGAARERSAAGLLEWLHRADRPAGAGPPLVLVLDGVTDPHNLGACLRSADAAGADAVLVPRDGAAGLTPAARKVACGAAETVPLFRAANLARSLDELAAAGLWLHGAAGEGGALLWDTPLAGPTAILCGAEERGLRRLTRERCDTLFRIPMAGSVESLNVSVAAGIALFEARRQRAAVGAGDPLASESRLL